jgi:hypothetical protein
MVATDDKYGRSVELPELLRGLGIEPFLYDPVALRAMRAAAWKLARKATTQGDALQAQRELDVFKFCSRRLAELELTNRTQH